MTQVSALYSKKTMFGLTSLVQTCCVHRDKSVLKMRLTLFVLFWLEGGLAEVWQATPLSFLSHSTAAKKPKYRCHGLRVYAVCVCNTVRLGQVMARHNLKPSGTRFECVSGLCV